MEILSELKELKAGQKRIEARIEDEILEKIRRYILPGTKRSFIT
ncbi:MAG: hypothetical protein PHC60_04635 [Heliobacteriaceae bacterium]|nr:hypothetical protein [Heliobacteriaceae bacterium]